MKTILIAAMAANRAIGMNGKLPWHLPEDLAHFKESTRGKPVIMGRKTYLSLPEKFRPLPGRRNVVITSGVVEAGLQAPTAGILDYFKSPEEAIAKLNGEGADDIFVIGWSTLYGHFLRSGLVDEIWLSLVPGTYEADSFFPDFETGYDVFDRIAFGTFELIKYRRKKGS